MQPIVDGIQLQYAGVLTVYQLDYNQPADQRIAHAYAVRSHPVLLIIDRTGVQVARWSGIVSQAEVVLALRNLVDIP
jgi:thioredoxin-related protein